MSDVTLKIGADAGQASGELTKLEKDVRGIGDAFKGLLELGALTATFGKLTDIIGGTIGDFKEAEQIGNKLNQSLVNQGIYSTELKGKYEELAGAIQKKTRFGDDDVKAGMAVAQGYLGQIEITEELTAAVADLAENQNIDLQSAFALVGKSVGGPTNALARYGVTIDKSKSKAEQLEQVIRGLNGTVGGQAEAAAQGLGSLDRLNNAFGEVSESIGKAFAPAVTAAANALADIAFWISENEEITEWVAILLGAATAIVGLTTVIVGVNFALATFGATIAAVALPVTLIVAAVVGLGIAWRENFLGIQEVTFGVFNAIKSLLNSMIDNLLATGKILMGVLTFDMDMIKEGLGEYTKSIEEAVGKTVEAYKQGYDDRVKAMGEADTKEADLVKKSEERGKTLAAMPAVQTEAQKKALEQREKDEAEAAKLSFDRQEKMLQDQIERINDEKEAQFDSMDLIEADREEADALLIKLHELRLARIEELELADVKRIEEIKTAEMDLDNAKRDLDLKAAERAKKRVEFEKKELADNVNTGLGFAGNVLDGKAGATDALGKGIGMGAEALTGIPGIGGAVGGIVSQLARGPEENKAMVKEFVESMPEIIEAVAESIPVVVEALVDSLITEGGLIRIGAALLEAMLFAPVFESIGAQLGLDFGSSLNSSNIAQTFGEKVFKPIREGFNALIDYIMDGFNAFLDSLFDFKFGNLNDMIDKLFAFKFEFPELPDELKQLGNAFKSLGKAPPWLEWLQEIVDSLEDAVDSVSGGGGDGSGGYWNPSNWKNQGGVALYAAQGFFPGKPRGSDMIPHWTAPGESIINQRSTAANRGLLEKINNSGGPVTADSATVVHLVPADSIGRAVADWLVQSSALGTGSLRFAVGSES